MNTRTHILIARLLLALLGTGNFLLAQNLDERYASAQAHLASQDYEAAIQGYTSLIAEGAKSFELYYQLGTAHYRMEHIGEAVLFFEKAVKLKPFHQDARFNLKLARQRVQDRFATPPAFFLTRMWCFLRDQLHPAWWIWAGVALFWLACALQAWRWWRYASQRYRIGRSTLVTTVLALTLLALGMDRQETIRREHHAVLLTSREAVKEVPDERANDKFNLNEGVKVRLLEELNGWWKVELPDGRSGWVQPEAWGRI